MLNLDFGAFCKAGSGELTASPDGPSYMQSAYNLSAKGQQAAAKNAATIAPAGPTVPGF